MASAPTFSLRPASAADFELLRGLHVRTMKSHVAATWGWDDDQQDRMFRDRFDPSRVQVIVVDGEDCGALLVERSAAAIFLVYVEIDPTHQRRGLGTAILRSILAEAAQAGLPVDLRVLKVNPARALYERLGFVVTGEIATHYLMRAEPSADGPQIPGA